MILLSIVIKTEAANAKATDECPDGNENEWGAGMISFIYSNSKKGLGLATVGFRIISIIIKVNSIDDNDNIPHFL